MRPNEPVFSIKESNDPNTRWFCWWCGNEYAMFSLGMGQEVVFIERGERKPVVWPIPTAVPERREILV
jgi:hypothetical protein